MEFSHGGSVRELLKHPESEGQRLLYACALLAGLHLLQLLEVLVQLQVIQDDGNEQAQHDLSNECDGGIEIKLLTCNNGCILKYNCILY